MSRKSVRPGKPGLAVRRIRGISSDADFKKGSALNAQGWVTSARTDGGDLTARVKDGVLYRVYVRKGRGGSIFCTCGARSKGACAHAVAAVLYASDNRGALLAEEEGREGGEAVARRMSRADLQKFLISEIKKNPDARRRFLVRFGGADGVPRVDYRHEVDVMYADVDYMTSWKNKLRFTDFFRAAKDRERRGHAAEAIRIYLEVSEGIEANHYLVDDSSGHYAETFGRAVHEMVACINRQNMGRDEKRPHIYYLHRQFLAEVPAFSEGVHYQALVDICTDAEDLEYLAELNGPFLPEGRVAGKDEYDVMSRVYLQAEVLEKLGRREAAGGLLKRHYRTSIGACGKYVKLLLGRDPARARSVLEEARGIFPDYQYKYISHLADGIK